jgi:type IV pilus assembly protein PilV
MYRHHRSRGFTLIEVMIALLIFSLGLMGMAGLMVLSVKTNHSAYLRTQASFLAQSMADRMRANMGLINNYNGTYSQSTASADPCASGAACSPAQIVARDRALWSRQLADSLPNASATVNCAGAVLGGTPHAGAAPYQGLCTLTIQWDEATLRRGVLSASPTTASADLQTFAWVFQP